MIFPFKFNGGIKPEAGKNRSTVQPIGKAPLPQRLFVPLHQALGGTPHPLVKSGARVLKGQMIGAADGWVSAAIHAPTSGIVRAVDKHLATHPSGLSILCVEIEADGKEEWIERVPIDPTALPPEEVRRYLRDSGIVGLGGAVFPTHNKLTRTSDRPVDTLVLNGAECEPYITCDDLLMRERAAEIVRGAVLFRDLLRARRVVIGIEDNTPEAFSAMRAAVAECGEGGESGENFQVVSVPTLYPTGSAKQLIRVLTGREVAATRRSTSMGVQCFNVATAYTAWRAVAHGEPILSRLTTLTGNVETPRNWDVLIGTPLSDFVALGSPRPDTDAYLMGGPMMGFPLPGLEAPIVKASNCIIAASPKLFPPPPPEMPCIRCTACAQACPQELQPFELYWHARTHDFDKSHAYHLFDCIECGCCSYVCPSHIPLVQYFRFAKSEIEAQERAKKAADGARARYEWRNERITREAAEKAERLAQANRMRKEIAATGADKENGVVSAGSDVKPEISPAAVPPHSEENTAEAAKKAAVAAALARARARRDKNGH